MKPWELLARRTWALIRDVAFAGFGLWLIYRETTDPSRSVAVTITLLSVATALTVPSAAEHIKAILPSSSGESAVESSSRSSERPGSPSSSTARGASGDGDG